MCEEEGGGGKYGLQEKLESRRVELHPQKQIITFDSFVNLIEVILVNFFSYFFSILLRF